MDTAPTTKRFRESLLQMAPSLIHATHGRGWTLELRPVQHKEAIAVLTLKTESPEEEHVLTIRSEDDIGRLAPFRILVPNSKDAFDSFVKMYICEAWAPRADLIDSNSNIGAQQAGLNSRIKRFLRLVPFGVATKASLPLVPVLAIVAIAVLFVLWRMSSYPVQGSPHQLERWGAFGAVVKAGVEGVGAGALLLTLLVAYKRLAAYERQVDALRESVGVQRTSSETSNKAVIESQLSDRFSKATEALSKTDELSILAGIYMLERIARDSARDHWTVIELLTSLLRRDCSYDEHGTSTGDTVHRTKQTILQVIGRRFDGIEDQRTIREFNDFHILDLRGLDLRGITVLGGRFELARFHGTCLECSVLRGSHLEGAELSGVNLGGADLRGAHFGSITTPFRGSTVRISQRLLDTHLEGANLFGAHNLDYELLREALIDNSTKAPTNYPPPWWPRR